MVRPLSDHYERRDTSSEGTVQREENLELETEMYEENNTLVFKMYLPATEPTPHIDLLIDNDVLRITGEQTHQAAVNNRQVNKKGFFEWVIPLPCLIDAEKAHAEQKNGILWVTLPLKKPVKNEN